MFAGPATALKAGAALIGLSLYLGRLDRRFAVFPEFVKVKGTGGMVWCVYYSLMMIDCY